VRGPVIIGRNTVVRDSFVGPYTSIYHHCEVLRSEVEHSIILERSCISDVPRMVDSLVGKEAVVRRSGALPRANRLMVGDHSVVDLG
jgi:glucose-1-phosphate thymidylyltransferase